MNLTQLKQLSENMVELTDQIRKLEKQLDDSSKDLKIAIENVKVHVRKWVKTEYGKGHHCFAIHVDLYSGTAEIHFYEFPSVTIDIKEEWVK